MKKSIRISLAPGFTLIEILVVTVLMAMIFSLGFFVSFNSYKRYISSSEKEMLVTLLYKARNMAQNNVNGTSHGVHIDPSRYVLFQGTSYNQNELSNQIFEKSAAIAVSGLLEVIFEPLSGNPNTTGVITIAHDVETKTITILNEGRIDW